MLMAVAATFLTVSATSALAQADPARNSAAELAIDAAIPRPEPANVPPPTINDFKPDATASVPDAAKTTTEKTPEKSAEPKPSEVVTAPAADTGNPPAPDSSKTDSSKADTSTTDANKADTATTTPIAAPAAATATPAAEPAKEPAKAASNVPPADQPVADKLREMAGAKSLRYFDRKAERTAVEKFYTAREYAPLWTQGGKVTENGKGVIARLKDAASEGLNAADYPVPDFTAATTPDSLADADLKLTASVLDYARQAQSGRMHWSQVSADIQYPDHPTDPTEVLANVTTAKDASAALDGYNPPQKLYRELKAKLAELRGQGNGPATQISEGPALKFTPARSKKQPAVEMEDARVPQLRAKLGITENADDNHYDASRRGRRTQIPGRRRAQAHRCAGRQDRQGTEQPEARPPDRHRDRQHGALALAAAPARRALDRQCLRHSQYPRLYSQGDAERRAGLDHEGRHRPARRSCDARF